MNDLISNFKLSGPQQIIIDSLEKFGKVVFFPEGRQCGATHVMCAYAVLYAQKNASKSIVFSCVNQYMCEHLVNYIRHFVDVDKISHKNQVSLNNSKITFVSHLNFEKEVRGLKLDCVLIDNACFINDFEFFAKSLFPQLHDDSKVLSNGIPFSFSWKKEFLPMRHL